MELFKRIIELIDINIFYCLIPMLLTLYLVQLIFKDRFETKKALNLIRWFVIFYALISIIFTLISNSTLISIGRATGPYLLTYWIMLFSSIILPFTLLIKIIRKTLFLSNFCSVLYEIWIIF